MNRLFLCLLVLAMSLSGVCLGQDNDDSLKDAFEAVLEELNTKDMEGFLKRWHSEAILYVPNYFFPVDRVDAGKEVWSEIFKDFFTKLPSATITPVDVEFRVVDDVGIVWGITQTLIQTEDDSRVSQLVRLTVTFIKSNNEWQILSWHGAVPPGRQGLPETRGN